MSKEPMAWADVVGILGTIALLMAFLGWIAWLVFA